VVAMRVGGNDMCDRPAGGGGHDRLQLGRVGRPRIDNRQAALADQIRVGALERERAAVRRDKPHDPVRHDARLAIGEPHLGIESQAFAHLELYWCLKEFPMAMPSVETDRHAGQRRLSDAERLPA
jgi:hypothetical protein